jgi:lipopolysaccharide biosynthesis glycosyltransferase
VAAALRILRVESERNFDIAICSPDISDVPSGVRSTGIRFCRIDIESLPEVQMSKEWISSAAYYRYLLPAHFRNEYGCLLYLDTDTYLHRPAIARLFASIDRPVALSAAYDTPAYGRSGSKADLRFAKKVEDLCGGCGSYYNSGVWLSQPEEFEKIGGWDRFRDAAVTCQTDFQHHGNTDQDAMNLAFAPDILLLNPMFNWFATAWLNDREVARYNPYILHFTGPNKPWKPNDDPYATSLLNEYVTELQRYFPEFRPKPVEDSLPWRLENPKFRFSPVQAISNWQYRRQVQRSYSRRLKARANTRFDLMDRAIAAAAVGKI